MASSKRSRTDSPSHPMAAESSAWTGLRVDLLGRVLERLPCLAHRAAFTAVCFNWRSLARRHPAPQQLPWLLLPSAGAQAPRFFCIPCGTTHRAALPDDVRGARCCGSCPGGWLVLALQQFRGYALHNLHTGDRFLLPEAIGTPEPPVGDHGLIMHVAARTPDVAYLAAAVTLSASSIAFWCHGMEHWSPPTPPAQLRECDSLSAMVPPGMISDVMYYSGHGLEGFHVLTDTEELLVHVLEHGALTTRLVTYRFPNHQATPSPPVEEGAVTRYLVDYSGELLMVVRAVSPEGSTLAFRVFRLTAAVPADGHGNRVASWFEIHIPGGVVVLGRCCSRVYGFFGRGLDGFYFLDDATSFHDVTRVLEATRQYPCSDMGWLPLLSAQFQRIFPERPPSEFSRAVWFFH